MAGCNQLFQWIMTILACWVIYWSTRLKTDFSYVVFETFFFKCEKKKKKNAKTFLNSNTSPLCTRYKIASYHIYGFLILSCGIILFEKELLLYWIVCHYKMIAFRKSYFGFMSVIINLDEDKQCRTFKCFTNCFHTRHHERFSRVW